MAPPTPVPQEATPPAPAPALSAGAGTPNSVTVSWTAPVADLALTAYELRWRRSGDSHWTEVDDLPSSQTSYTIAGLLAGTAYQVQVRARYAGRDGAWSQLVAVETAAATESSPPVLAQGTRTPASVTVSWTAPVAGLAVTGYDLRWRRSGDSHWTEVDDLASSQTSYTITGLLAGTAYQVQVRARYATRDGAWSQLVTVETMPATESSPPVLTQGTRTPAGVTVSWTAPVTDLALTGYDLRWRRSGDSHWTEVDDLASSQTSYTITGLLAGTAYQVQVRARYATRDGAWSQLVTAETTPPPVGRTFLPPGTLGAPAVARGSPTSTSVTVSWTAPVTDLAISGYDLRWRRSGDSSWTEVDDLASSQTSYTITGLHAETAYQVQVRALSGTAGGDWSQAVTVETAAAPGAGGSGTPSPADALGHGRIVQVVERSTSLMVVWEPTAGATGYELQWREDSVSTWSGATGISATATTYTITGLKPDTGYKVRLRPVAGSFTGKWFTTSVGTLRSERSEPAFSIAWEHSSYDESDGAMAFIVSTADEVPEAVTVLVYVSESGSMVPDYLSFKIPVGVTTAGGTTVKRSVPLQVDTEDEPDSTVIARIIAHVGYGLGTSPTATATVRDDD